MEGIWEEHCRDSALLSDYAKAMHQLATDIWAKQRATRLDWCRAACNEYFFSPDGLRKIHRKEERRLAYRTLHGFQSNDVDQEIKMNLKSKKLEVKV